MAVSLFTQSSVARPLIDVAALIASNVFVKRGGILFRG